MQQHGFARNLDWEISTSSADLQPDDKDPSVELTITDNDYTRAMWYESFLTLMSSLDTPSNTNSEQQSCCLAANMLSHRDTKGHAKGEMP